jgi:hypothetical protein
MTFALVATAAQTPTTPVIAATALSPTSIQIALTTPSVEPQLGVAYYLLQRALAGNPFVQVAQVSPGSFPYLDTGLITGDTYLYRAIAVNNSTNRYSSAPSSVVSATTAGASPNGATIPPATQLIDNGLSVWTVVSGVVYVQPPGGSNAPAGFSSGVTLLLWYGGTIYQEAGGVFYPWTGTTWGAAQGDPRTSSSFGIQVVGSGLKTLGAKQWIGQGAAVADGVGNALPMMAALAAFTASNWAQIGAKWFLNCLRFPVIPGYWNQNATYQANAITTINALGAAGMVALVDTHWDCPSGYNGGLGDGQPGYLGDQALTYAASLGTAVKSKPWVVYEMFNEPFAGPATGSTYSAQPLPWTQAQCDLLRVGTVASGRGNYQFWDQVGGDSGPFLKLSSFPVVGYQQLINAFRGAGAPNPVVYGTSGWNNYIQDSPRVCPTDTTAPAGFVGTWTSQLIASIHYAPSGDYPTGYNAIFNGTGMPGGLGIPMWMTEYNKSTSIGGQSWMQSKGMSYNIWSPSTTAWAQFASGGLTPANLLANAPWAANNTDVFTAYPP